MELAFGVGVKTDGYREVLSELVGCGVVESVREE
jgi:hypothetical protein